MWPLSKSIFGLFIIFLFVSPGNAEDCALKTPVEIVVLFQSWTVNTHFFKLALDATRSIPTYFPMGPELARVSVIRFSDVEAEVALNMTTDARSLETLVVNYSGHYIDPLLLRDAMVKARQVLRGARPGAQKVIVMTANRYLGHRPNADQVAADLREDGCLIYVAYLEHPWWDHNAGRFERYTGSRSNIFPIENFGEKTKEIICTLVERARCQHRQGCGFDGQGLCRAVWYRPQDPGTCTNQPPITLEHQCAKKDCDETCDQWPWKPVCDDPKDAGKKVDVGREGAAPSPREIFRTCPATKEVVCPTFYATKTTKRGTRTRSSPPPSTDESGEATTELTTSALPTSPGYKPLETWQIALIVIGSLILLLLTGILAAVFVKRRKSRKFIHARRPHAHFDRGRHGPSGPPPVSRTAHSKPTAGGRRDNSPQYYETSPWKPGPSVGNADQRNRYQSKPPATGTYEYYRPVSASTHDIPKGVGVPAAVGVSLSQRKTKPSTGQPRPMPSKLPSKSPKPYMGSPSSKIPRSTPSTLTAGPYIKQMSMSKTPRALRHDTATR